jgi:phosphate transport system substrate-binding protein
MRSLQRLAATCLSMAASVALSARADAAQTLTIAGSTTLLPLVRQAAESYQSDHADVLLVVSGGGSRAALEQLANKEIDMAATDMAPRDNYDLVDHRIAVIPFAVAVDSKAGVSNLTRAELADIFAGRLTNWKAVGGNDLPIAVVNRPPGSGIRELVAQTVMGRAQFGNSPLEDESTSALVNDLKSNPGAIGYGSVGGLSDSGLILVAIDGVPPTEENVESGAYPLWAYEHVITNGPATPDESRFMAYLETNRSLLHKYGYIAVRDMKVSLPDT